MKRFLELSHVLEDGMVAYPGLPRPKIGAFLDHKDSRSCYENKAELYLQKRPRDKDLGDVGSKTT